MRDLVLQVKEFEMLAIQAARSGDRDQALAALRANPLVGGRVDPAPLLDALLDANRSTLPQFFPDSTPQPAR
jgi:6-phospho-beta-glucosidase